ncbi:hypothetical protein [Cucumibacter marinus]|uniref:hypothetical protein n=1 Tax=Cucumibacter marinus TaxID=1121252 RepID=UPI00048E2BF7|nr:hypothetical protein [Cucumibacter marinus]
MTTHTQDARRTHLENDGGPTIRNLLLRQSGDTASRRFLDNYRDLLALPAVSHWRSKIPNEVSTTSIMGSSDACFENSYGKLVHFGLSASDIITRSQLRSYVSFLSSDRTNNVYEFLARYVVAGYLYASGCQDEEAQKFVEGRIDRLHDFSTQSPLKFDIYGEGGTSGIPKAHKNKKVVNPDLYEGGELILPLIHDIFIFSRIYNTVSAAYRTKIDAIIDYVAHEEYQSLDYGYGLVRSEKNRFHFMGWSAHLPLFNAQLSVDYFRKGLIFRLALFSEFKNRRIQSWRRSMLQMIDEFRIDEIRYCFPGDLLPETPNSYFLNGRHTALNENRRQKSGRILESTYYAYLANRVDGTPQDSYGTP